MATVDVRTGIELLEPNECWDLLRSAEVGRLAIAIANHPDIFPVNYIVDHGSVVFRTAEGTKLSGAVCGKGVAFEVDGYDAASRDAWSVVVKGEALEIEALHERFDALTLPLFPWQAAPKHWFVRIVPAELTGRRFRVVDSSVWSEATTGTSPAAPE